ncbi:MULTISPECIES: ABC transporter ATP-binding protein [unclassified Serratia (in: enterobacteria)]|uniref:ABC transporter ATP-binding protein n=1 Tax=unclassified Serratia (in: enterobacteria) TaxID=2647522 RepID=UPI0005021321|nr:MULTISPECIES: ABC transporter ATP-binding protein [unclassified Serratia (in: enterobacteria)]KFK95085.1 branched-chain amino acid ABC transporter ATP-binding protein [Serratia sp. Ag2]KFK96260.1 branched-chain amino acid ABC transporter ATP-binding protein [Serratia sp. Ag1]
MLSLRGVNQYYGHNHILWDISLELPRGQCTLLLGRNGVGKTTLVNCIMGYLPIVSGSMTWQLANQPPHNLLQQPMEKRAALGISHVPQGRQIFSQLSVEENLQIALLAGGDKTRRLPPMIYSLFPHLHTRRLYRAGDLCGDEQQQLAIARALVLEPELLILDEPTSGISPSQASEISRIIRTLNHEFGMTILLVEHTLPCLRQVADGFFLIDQGRNVVNGPLEQLDAELISTYLVS